MDKDPINWELLVILAVAALTGFFSVIGLVTFVGWFV